ncbi:MAG: ABC-type phosphate transport system substrate-binding protein [Luteibaculaceae bacterium]|jgi:ABC-type phosphate transport system substrate-binding protein
MKPTPTYRPYSTGLTGLLIMCFLTLHNFCSAQIAVIVNPENPVSEISVNQLRAIFMGKQVYFDQGNDLIKLCDFETDLNDFCEKLYGFSSKTMNKHWFQLIFSGTSANVPKKLNSPDELIQYISKNKSAIGYIDLKKIPEGLEGYKIISLDGKLPTSSGYFLSFIESISSLSTLTYAINSK